MASLRRWLRRLSTFVRTNRAEAELTREISSHLRFLEDEFIAKGMSAEEARYAARRAFGGVEQAKEHQREARSFGSVDSWWLDLKLGVRMLAKYPGLSLVIGAGIAVTIAVCATTFAVLYASVHPTLPLDEGERIVGLENIDTAWNNQEDRILHDFFAWREELTAVQQVSAAQVFRRNLVDPAGDTVVVQLAEMSASGFDLARVPPLLGRYLVADDERLDAPAVALIGYELWRTRFSEDPSVLGRIIKIGHTSYTLVGVMPRGFAFPLNQNVWVPFRARAADYDRRRGPHLVVFGRLSPHTTRAVAEAEITAIGERAAAAYPDTHARLRPRIVRYTELWFDDGPRSTMHYVQVLVSMLVIVVGVNVAILVYARTATRQAEILIRTAIGATRRRIVAQLFVEALVLAVVAALVGLVITRVLLAEANTAATLFGADFGGLPFWMTFRMSWGTVIYAGGLAILTAVVAGVVPAMKATGRHLQTRLGQLGAGAGPRLGRTWTSLVVLQVAAVVGVLPAAAFLAAWSVDLANVKAGFPVDEYLSTRVLMDADVPPTADVDQYFRSFQGRYRQRFLELIDRVQRDPAVTGVTVMSREPGVESLSQFEVEHGTSGATSTHVARNARVAADLFSLFEVPVLTGRIFTAADYDSAAPPVIVNRSFVEQILRDPNPLGRRVRYAPDQLSRGASNPWREIVGVVADFPVSPVSPEGPAATIYHPYAPGEDHGAQLAVRLRRGAVDAFIPRLRQISAAIDPALQLTRIKPLAAVYRQEQMGLRWSAAGVALVTLSILLLAAAGIYALMSVSVTRRTREIGIRMALGADRGDILRSVFRRAFWQLGTGVVAGLSIALLVDFAAGGLLMNNRGAIIVTSVVIFMIAVGCLAAYGPARRALRIDPTEALRADG